MLFRKKFFYCFVYISIFFTFSLIHTEVDLFDILDTPEMDYFLDHTEFHIGKRSSPETIIDLLKAFGAFDLLQQDFYLQTHPLNKRSLLDYPIFVDYNEYGYDWISGIHLLWNMTSKSNFTKRSTSISSYLGILNENLLQRLSADLDVIREIFPDFTVDPISVIPLFKNLTVEERRFGLMFHFKRRFESVQMRILFPLLYLERNFNFPTAAERDRVEQLFGEPDKQFQEDHLISDAFGFGDTRITFEFPIKKKTKITVKLGAQVTIPTAFAFTKGLKGTSFKKDKPKPSFSFQELFKLGEKNSTAALEKALDFFLGALDRLSTNLLDPMLGNHNHLGIGIILRTKTPLQTFIKRSWARNFAFQGRISFEYLFPARERRFFIDKVDPEELNPDLQKFDPDFLEENPILAQESLAFLERTFVNKFYPFVLTTTVHPGIIIRWTSATSYTKNRWKIQLGSDLWAQTRESLHSIQAPENLRTRLDVDKARKPVAYLSKLHGGIFYTIDRDNRTWVLSLNGDETFSNVGVGEDFSLSFNVEVHF